MINDFDAADAEKSSPIHGTNNCNRNKLYQIFDQTFSEFSVEDVFLSFNGGKDCTVLLDALQSYFKVHERLNFPIAVVYIQPQNSFEEVEDFIHKCEKRYGIQIERRQGSLKECLQDVCHQNPRFKAVIMGCRQTDPNCSNLQTMQVTDSGWPSLLRINPLLDWSCRDVWKYIHNYSIPYCSLYNEGYSSLGDKTNTRKNPNLLRLDPKQGNHCYVSAGELTDDLEERIGRI